jgi:AraC-like DNA-binding protein
VDALAAVLQSLRLKSAVMSLAQLSGRWGVSTRGVPHAMIFHGVIAGSCVIRRNGDAEAEPLEAGHVAFLSRGEAHAIASDEGADPVPITQLSPRMEGAVPVFRHGSPGDETRIVCGSCVLDHPAAASVVELLPRMLVSRPAQETRRRWTLATLALLEDEITSHGSNARIVSLTDAVFVHLVAECAARESAPRNGLLAAVRDEQIGRALALVHSDPAKDWGAVELAARVGMSRTRFFERFAELVGEPPAKYVARWRVLAAVDLLRNRTLSTQLVAERVGYSSEDALGRAFKRHMGMSVGEWRRAREALS